MSDALNFIDSTKNDKISYLRGLDLQELIVQIENYYLEYRDTLNLINDVTFGTEIEYEGIDRYHTDKFIENKEEWRSKGDGSLNSGGEIISPVLTDQIKTWQELKEICSFLKQKKVITTGNAAGHVHVGAHILGNDCNKWIKFIKLYIIYEHIIFRFIYGDKINLRKKGIEYAKPIADDLYAILHKIIKIKDVRELSNLLPDHKYQAINFKNINYHNVLSKRTKNTLEFRGPNASSEEIIWQNNINALTKSMLSPNSLDEEFLNYKLKYERVSYITAPHLYTQICLKNVLEFCDLVFDNNLDKVYFLRQYIKGFQENFQSNITYEAKKFTR